MGGHSGAWIVSIHIIIDCNEADIFLWKHYLGIKSDLKIVSSETAHILYDDRTDISCFNLCQQSLKSRAIKVTPGVSVVGEVLDANEAVFSSVFLQIAFLIGYAIGFALLLVIF